MAVIIDPQPSYISRCQTCVSERPTVAVIRGAIHACSASCCSGKNSSRRIDRERPNVAAIQTIVYRCPAVAIISRSENAAAKIRTRKNVAIGIDCQSANISLDHVVINFYPAFSVIAREIDAAGTTYKIGSDENVTIVESKRAFIKRTQAIINLLPILPAIDRAKHASAV